MKNKKILINIIIIIGFMIIVSSKVFVQKLSNLDEIWNYNFSRCIINGLLPYKDFNIIITPLFAYIGAMFLKIFGDEMIVFRVAEVIQTSLILFMIFKVLDRINVNKGLAIITSLVIYSLFVESFCFDYNWAVLFMTLIILYIELKEEKNEFDYKRNMLIGILSGTTILIKQTSGIVLSVIIILYKIIEVNDVRQLKAYTKILLTRILGVCIPILLFAIYLTINNIWPEFVDYAILGVRTFSNSIAYSKLIEMRYIPAFIMPIFLIIIIVTSFLTIIFKKIRNEKWTKRLRTLMFFDIAATIVIYPISDKMHFSVASIITLMTMIYLINLCGEYLLKKESDRFKSIFNIFLNVIVALTFVIMIAFSTKNIIEYKPNDKYLKHFKFINTDEGILGGIEDVDEYIKNQNEKNIDVIILNSMAAVINIPIDKYYKNYDMFNLGNFGAEGEQGIIDDLNNRENTVFLIRMNEKKENWQSPKTVVDYIKNNYSIIGRIYAFEIYSK